MYFLVIGEVPNIKLFVLLTLNRQFACSEPVIDLIQFQS